jgi:hypothetical protein
MHVFLYYVGFCWITGNLETKTSILRKQRERKRNARNKIKQDMEIQMRTQEMNKRLNGIRNMFHCYTYEKQKELLIIYPNIFPKADKQAILKHIKAYEKQVLRIKWAQVMGRIKTIYRLIEILIPVIICSVSIIIIIFMYMEANMKF